MFNFLLLLCQLNAGFFAFCFQMLPSGKGKPCFCFANTVSHRPITGSLTGLFGQLLALFGQLGNHILNALQIIFGIAQTQLCLMAALMQALDIGGFLD